MEGLQQRLIYERRDYQITRLATSQESSRKILFVLVVLAVVLVVEQFEISLLHYRQ